MEKRNRTLFLLIWLCHFIVSEKNEKTERLLSLKALKRPVYQRARTTRCTHTRKDLITCIIAKQFACKSSGGATAFRESPTRSRYNRKFATRGSVSIRPVTIPKDSSILTDIFKNARSSFGQAVKVTHIFLSDDKITICNWKLRIFLLRCAVMQY